MPINRNAGSRNVTEARKPESRSIRLSPNGLDDRAVRLSRARFGSNTLSPPKKKSPLWVFVGQFKDVMTVILIAAVVLSVVLGETAEAVTILCIVLLNSVLGFVQEYRTERALERLRAMTAPMSRVLRSDTETRIPSGELVVGDAVLLSAGDRIPADGVLIESADLRTDESLLTGESVPVEKHSAEVTGVLRRLAAGFATERLTCHPDPGCRVHMGCMLTAGRGVMLVEAVGEHTEMGKVAGMLREIREGPTPLQKQLDRMGRVIAVGCVGVCGVVAATGLLRGEDMLSMLLTGVSLAVAAVPEGLSAIVTISLALAVGRIYRRGAWMKKLHAVESLGCATVICSDKTGTLTQNRMTVQRIFTAGQTLDVTGAVSPEAVRTAALLCETAALCSSGRVRTTPKGFEATGDPTEAAILVAAARCGARKEELLRSRRIDREIPFDSTRKRMSVVVSGRSGSRLCVKGAPDLLLERCTGWWDGTGVRPMTPADRRRFAQVFTDMAKDALRVVAAAYRDIRPGESVSEDGLVFVGCFGMLDPPRREAAPAVRRCRQAGIRPIMITGDHPETACAIAARVGIFRPGDACYTGRELDAMDDDAFAEACRHGSVFARVSPAHKLRLVRGLRAQGQVAAMTGDGVNDAPAVKEADVGVAMGKSGTDVTREAAGVVLMDDNFATLVTAVEEGRAIYANIRKFIRYLLSCNIGEVLTMFVGMLLGLPAVLLPIQILTVNLVTDGLPALMLGLEPPDPNVMRSPPRRPGESIFAHGLGALILLRGILIGATALGVFLLLQDAGLETARSGAFLALVLAQLLHVFECKSETKPLFAVPFRDNPKLILAVLSSAAVIFGVLYIPACHALFSTVALSLSQLGTVLLCVLAAPVISMVLRPLLRRREVSRRG